MPVNNIFAWCCNKKGLITASIDNTVVHSATGVEQGRMLDSLGPQIFVKI